MGKYIRSFSTAADQAAAPAVNPAVDWVIEGDTVIYTPYEPPFTGKVKLTYSDGSVYTAACDSNTTLTTGDTKPSGYEATAITSAEIGSCVTSIGNNAFKYCSSLTSITIPDSVTTIGEDAFFNCQSLTSITIPDSVTKIGALSFVGTKLTSIQIPDSVTTIVYDAFSYLYTLTSVTIGSGITTLGDNVFESCTGLTSITIEATTPPTLGYNTFNNTNNCPIYVPAGSVDAYKEAWSTYANRIQAIPT